MSIADYTQRAEDHQTLLVLLKPLIQLKTKSYTKILDRVTNVSHLQIPDSKRSIWLRYKRLVHLENNDWGDFQVHRRVAGLICMGKATTEIELATAYSNFDTMKQVYRYTLFDSRCFVFGMSQSTVEKTVSGVRPDVIYYPSFDDCDQLEDHVKDFALSLFWVLESKRLDRTSDKNDRLPLLMAPFERKDMVGIDTETRNFRRKVQGRMRKHLADLNMIAGMTHEAYAHYQSALEILKGANDWLWIGACLEGMCAASVIQLYPPKQAKAGIPRNASFNSNPLIETEKQNRSGNFETANGLPDKSPEERLRNCLAPEDIIEKYKEAILQYGKYTSAAIVEMEASIKATQVLIQQRKTLEAADFLQNIIYINVNLSDNEKVQRYSALCRLFGQIGFHRKAAFFKRVAAMQCVTPHNPNPAWSVCHQLLLETMPGYKLSLERKEFPSDHPCGWHILQMRLLNELVFTARRMGDQRFAVRYLTFLLHTMHEQISFSELKDIASTIEMLTRQTPGTPHALALDNGAILPAVPFTKFPTIRSFKLIPLSSQLMPLKKKHLMPKSPSSDSIGPFIYSPIQSREPKDTTPKPKVDFKWVAGDVCEVCLKFYNPLPFELRVANMGFLTEGLNFDSIPASITLPAKSGPHSVSILGTPKTAGSLTISGYTTTVLGVESHCRLRNIPSIPEPHYEVIVVPALPLLRVTTSLPKAVNTLGIDPSETKMSTSAAVTLLAGESCECEVKLINSGKVPVESLNLQVSPTITSSINNRLNDLISWSKENIETQLPLQPGNQILFTLYIKSIGSFVGRNTHNKNDIPVTPTPSSANNKPFMGTPTRSPSMSHLEMSKQDGNPDTIDSDSLLQSIEGTLRIQYSGGPGAEDEYHREASVLLRVHIKPSIIFTQWTAIPATDPRQFHLVLDTLNASGNDMEIQYGDQCTLALQSHQSKRMAVRVDRFQPSRSKVGDANPCLDDDKDTGNYEVDCWEPTAKDVTTIGQVFSQQLATMVDIRWKCLVTGRSGTASVEALALTSCMLDHIQICPIQWEVSLNSSPANQDEATPLALSQPLQLSVSVINKMDEDIGPLYLDVQPYLDHQNGSRETNPGNKVVCAGCCHCTIEQLKSESNFQFHLSFVFLYPGLYKFNIICRESTLVEDQEDSMSQNNPVSPQSPRFSKGFLPIIVQEDPITEKREAKVWKYRPAIEVLVTE